MEPFGAWIRREREQRGITLEEISLSTKIRSRFLEALEEDRLDQLPGGIIGRGFVRSIANYIGIDQDEAVAGYLAARPPSSVEPIPVPPKPVVWRYIQVAMRPPNWVVAIASLAFYCGLIAISELRQHEALSNSSAQHLFSVGFPLPPAKSNGVSGQSIHAAANSESTLEHLTTNSTTEKGGFSSASISLASPKSDNFTLRIKVREDAWLSIVADGQRVLADTLVAPTERLLQAQKLIVIRAGNIGAVDFSFNGESLPSQGSYDEVRTLSFDPNGLQASSPRANLITPLSERIAP